MLPTWLSWRTVRIAAVASLAAWGTHNALQVHRLEARIAADALAASIERTQAIETARETERLANLNNSRIADELHAAKAARDAAARTAAQRLRELTNARRDSATTEAALATCRSYEGPAVRAIPDQAREALVELATDADEVADRLRSCQAYILDVVQPWH